MDYEFLTDDQRRQTAEQQILEAEHQHYQLELNIARLRALQPDPAVATEIRSSRKAQSLIETAIAATKAAAAQLEADESPLVVALGGDI